MRTLIWEDICTSVFSAALFTIAKIWKLPKCPLVDEWIKMYMCTHTHTHTQEDYSALEKNDILSFTATWIVLGYYAKWNKSEKDKYHMISPICRIWKLKHNINRLIDTENKPMVAREDGIGETGKIDEKD